ncbi:MAG TPA: sigma-54 dependent transcriptional regulator [Gemmataceae bacterium]|nr:sigma-54 dependent transcriptional regulator [Gemmataceae bacterium]
MSAAAMRCESMRPVLPFLRETANRAETVVGRAGALGLPSHPPASAPAHLLVLDEDTAGLAEQLRRAFPGSDTRVQVAGSGPGGLRHVRADSPDVIVLGLDARAPSGLEIYQQIRQLNARVPVIFVTSAGRADAAIEAMKHGAYDFLFQPIELPVLRRVVGEALDVARRMRALAVACETETDLDAEGALVGSCPAMREVYKAIGRVAGQDVPVLITGESGTGKELVARAIYQHGARARAPFLALNCAAIPEPLLESELFGHEKGAFTGADRKRIGKFEQVSGGTLFLDEIGDMPLALQAKMLRLLQDQTFERVGGSETVRTDVRLIAATHRDLTAWSAEGKFRPDLYYRLGVFTIHLPALRERGDDLPLLVRHYLRRFSRELGREVQEVAPEALERLRGYPWPGNIRELQSVLKQGLLQASGTVLLPAFLPELPGGPSEVATRVPPGADFILEAFIGQRLGPEARDLYADTHHQVDRVLLPRVLEYTGGNQHQAARLLGIARQTLRLKLRELGLHVTHSVEADGDDLS